MRRTTKPGFTLVELLIAMALSVLVGGILYLLQSTGLSQVSKGTTRLTLQSEMRRKLERLVQDLRCADEVAEITPDSIKILQRKSTGDENNSGDIELYTVNYSVEKKNKRSVLIRSDNKEPPTEIFAADHIESEVLFPFYEEPAIEDRENPNFFPYDMKTNDSGQRKNITFIRIRMKARQNKEFITLVTAVTLRPAHQRLIQPHWKLR